MNQDRRDALKALLGLPFVKNLTEITPETRAFIFQVDSSLVGEDVKLDADKLRVEIDRILKEAGLSHIPYMIVVGLSVEVFGGDGKVVQV
jgi:hypothetical protein